MLHYRPARHEQEFLEIQKKLARILEEQIQIADDMIQICEKECEFNPRTERTFRILKSRLLAESMTSPLSGVTNAMVNAIGINSENPRFKD